MADTALRDLVAGVPGVALVAVGGHGRRELAPGSDLDLLLLHSGRRDIAAVAERVWYPVWDAKVGLDHSVRTVKEALAVAADDLKAALGLLSARCIAGDVALCEDLGARVLDQWRRRLPRWLPALVEAVAGRGRVFGEVAFLLEPDVKEGRGGLRDGHALHALARAVPAVTVEPAVEAAYAVLLDARVELHRRTGRVSDVLLLQEQDAVAAALGYSDADGLMTAVSAAARTLSWALDDGLRRATATVAGPGSRLGRRDQPLGDGLVLRDGEVMLAPDADPAQDATLPLRAAAASAGADAPLSRGLLSRLGADAPALPDPWPDAARQALVTLLSSGALAVPAFETLDQYGLLVRALPEWAPVRCRPQRNAYHRFTVDRHLWETAAQAAALTSRVARPDLLLVAAFLHDIGKGYPGDHTVVGMDLVAALGLRLGFPKADVDVLVSLVRHHLLLAKVASRRDLSDPATIVLVADAVGDRETLELLAALTEADSIATGPAAWSPWKAGLVGELVSRTAALLSGARVAPADSGVPTDAHRALMSRRELAVDVTGPVVTVVAPDRPGLLWRVAGTLALHGLDVRSAIAAGEDGMAVQVFDVESSFGVPPDRDRLLADLTRALSGRLSVEARLGERSRAYAGRRRAVAAAPAVPRVTVDNDASAVATIVEVRAPDAMGVLYRITRALADCELDVLSAKVATLGHEVVDAFYVRDALGAKVTDAEHVQEIERAVLAEITRPL